MREFYNNNFFKLKDTVILVAVSFFLQKKCMAKELKNCILLVGCIFDNDCKSNFFLTVDKIQFKWTKQFFLIGK